MREDQCNRVSCKIPERALYVNIPKVFEDYIDGQYRRPTGIVGRIIANRMARQHQPENAWTVSLLRIQPADHILEIGFGPGTTIQRLASLAPEGFVAGIDYSPTMVNLAYKRNIQAIKESRVDLRHGEAMKLPFANQSFDKAISIHTLYFWQEPLRALAEVQRVLKPGGMLALTILPGEKWPNGGNGTALCHVYSGNDVVNLLVDAGFSSAHIETGSVPEQFSEIAVIGVK
ncbi:MAG: class I SAM-dependent methyltransferase [Chloroflexi bacterium]|nr:MAG: class I SAM-dependent methyltransferase [Chloroflexota bacterium]